ncbi:MAG: outer membrane beta-barrel protein [Lysobacteraceae bacterium]
MTPTRSPRPIHRATGAAALLAISTSCLGLDLNYRLGVFAEHSDNIARQPVTDDPAFGPIASDTAIAPYIGFALTQDGDLLSLQAAGDLERRRYVNDSFDDESRTRMGLRAAWRLLPERLTWALDGVLSDQPVNVFAVEQPDNLQRTRLLVTGPTLALRPTARTRLLLEARYTNTDAEQTIDFNSDRWSAAVRGLWELSSVSTLSFNAEHLDARFDVASSFNADYQRQDLFARFDRRSRRGDWSADLGVTRVGFDEADPDAAEDETRPLLRLRGGLQLTELTRLEASLLRQFSDSSQYLLGSAPTVTDYELPIGLPNLSTTAVSADLYDEKSASLGIARRSDTVYLRVDAYLRRFGYEINPELDQDAEGVSVGISRQITPAVAVGGYAAREWRDYTALLRDDRELRYGATLDWRWSRHFGVSLDLSHNQRDSSDPLQAFDDNRVVLSINYVR